MRVATVVAKVFTADFIVDHGRDLVATERGYTGTRRFLFVVRGAVVRGIVVVVNVALGVGVVDLWAGFC